MAFRLKLTEFNKSKLNYSLVSETVYLHKQQTLGEDSWRSGPTADFKVKLKIRLQYTLHSSMKLAETFFPPKIY